MSTIAALVLTYNEEDYIKECLESIKWVDEIVIIDSYSSDETIKIARNYTDKVYKKEFFSFSEQRNYGINKIKSDWILSIDADERVSDELKNEIQREINKNINKVGYKIPFHNHFLGKWIKYCGWYPDYHLRLFKRGKGDFGNNKVHEEVNITGEIGKLTGYINHFSYDNLSEFISKTDYYTNLAAEEMYEKNKKFKLIDLIIRPFWRFFKMYFLKKGYKDGSYGFILSSLYFIYGFIKYAKLWELNISD